ncbi:MAG: hypothetical protein PGN37_01230 [Mycobacterium kyogaense]
MGTTRTERVVRPVNVVTLAEPGGKDYEADFLVPLAQSAMASTAKA